MSEQPGRYRRSFSGLVVAMAVTVLAVAAFVAWRGLFRETPQVEPEPVDYLESVTAAGDAGIPLVHPPTLPDGWIATTVDFEPGEVPSWYIGMLTDEERFVGMRQSGEDVDDLLATYVDENTTEGRPVDLDSSLAPTWRTWSDDGGDLAYAAEPASLPGTTVIVYGSAPAEDQERLIESLVVE